MTTTHDLTRGRDEAIKNPIQHVRHYAYKYSNGNPGILIEMLPRVVFFFPLFFFIPKAK